MIHTDARAPGRRALLEATVQARSTSRDTLRKTLCGDLGAVMLKALAKQPAQRYASVDAFNADLACWLSGQTVQARTPSAAYRVGKFVRRHKLSALLGSSAIASLLAIAVVAVLLGQRAQRESARAFAARDFMLHIFQRANQERSRGTEITARELLETGRRDVLIRLAGQPELQAEILRGIANVQSDMGDYVNADATLGELVQIYMSALRQPREESMARADQAYNALQMNNVVWAQRRLADAQAVPGRPLADPELNANMDEVVGRIAMGQGDVQYARTVFENARRTAVEELGERNSRTLRLGQGLARAELQLGNLELALSMQDKLRREIAQVYGPHSSEVAAADWERVNLMASIGKYAESSLILESALRDCIESLGSQADSCRHLTLKKVQTLFRLGRIEEVKGLLPEIRKLQTDSFSEFLRIEAGVLELRIKATNFDDARNIELIDRLHRFGRSGDDLQMPSSFKGAALVAIAEAMLTENRLSEAHIWIKQTFEVLGQDNLKGNDLRIYAIGKAINGVAFLKDGKLTEALEEMNDSQNLLEKVLGSDHPTRLLYGLNRAILLAELNRLPEAVSIVDHAIPILGIALGIDSPAYQKVLRLRSDLELSSDISNPKRLLPHDHEIYPRKDFHRMQFFG